MEVMTSSAPPSDTNFGGGGREFVTKFAAESMSDSTDSSTSSSLPRGTTGTGTPGSLEPPPPSSHSCDDPPSHVYTNIREIEELNSRPIPPTPRSDAQPRRDLLNGWYEYETDVGRTFFHNRETGKSQWIPPRFIRTPAQVQEFLRATRTNFDETCTFEGGSSTSSCDEHKENHQKTSTTSMRGGDDRKSEMIEDEEVFDEVADDVDEDVPTTTTTSSGRPLPIPMTMTFSEDEEEEEEEDDFSDDSDEVEEKGVTTTTTSSTSGAMMPNPYVQLSTFQSTQARPKEEDTRAYYTPPDALLESPSSSTSSPPPPPLQKTPTTTRVRRPSPASLRSVSFHNNKCTVLKNVPMAAQVLPTSSTTIVTSSSSGFNTPDRPSILPHDETTSTTTTTTASQERRGSSEGGSREPVRTIRCGDMERTEKEETAAAATTTTIGTGGKRMKREWVANYMYLTTAHLILYKDQKSAEKHGKHYDAPQGVWDLRGAHITWFQEEKKDVRKSRHYIQLELCNTKKYLLRCAAQNDTDEWFQALEEVVAKLPSAGSSTQAVIDVTTSVARNPSYIGSTRPLSHALIPISRSMRRRDDPMSQSAIDSMSTSAAVDESRPSKETILEKLRRFFRTRPTVEALKEKGIYKPEPVFGSTLAAICQHENSLVPKFIRVITEVIESKGLETDGIYRVSGNLSAVQKIRCQADQDNYRALVAEEDIHVLTGALKLFFRELGEPLFPLALHKEYTSAMQTPNVTTRFKKFEELLGRLPNENRETLKLLLRHLNLVAAHSSQNRMQQHNLAIVFGPTLFHNGDGAASIHSTGGASKKDKKGAKKTKASKKEEPTPAPIQSNSHLAFSMIMQSQIVQYLLESANKFDILKAPVNIGR